MQSLFVGYLLKRKSCLFTIKPKNKIKRGMISARILVCIIFLIATSIARAENSPKNTNELIQVIKRHHLKPLTEQQIKDAITADKLNTLDPHMQFYSAKEFEEFSTYTSGEFCGVGIEIRTSNGRAEIISVLANGSAFSAGIASGDQVVAVNDVRVDKLSSQQVMKHLLGKQDTKVKLSIVSDQHKEPKNFVLVRRRVELPSVEVRELSDGVIYLKIRAFYENTYDVVERELKKDSCKGLVLDLRDNPGGLLDSAVDVASMFLHKGRITTLSSRERRQEYNVRNVSFKVKQDVPIVVVINRNTASAAEVLTGALQDHKRAKIIGEKSFGKGSVQEFVMLSDGSALGLTTASYYTPLGREIDGIGIIPDKKISNKKSNNSQAEKETGGILAWRKEFINKETDDFLSR